MKCDRFRGKRGERLVQDIRFQKMESESVMNTPTKYADALVYEARTREVRTRARTQIPSASESEAKMKRKMDNVNTDR